jgi:hypothetical protein
LSSDEASTTSGRLVTIGEGELGEFVLDSDSLTLGRAETNQIVVQDEGVSRTHLLIERDPTGLRIADLGSANGTFVNGELVTSAVLRHGDTLVVGATKFRYETGGAPPTKQLMTIPTPNEYQTAIMANPLSVVVNDTTTPCLVVAEAGRTWRVDLGDAVVIEAPGRRTFYRVAASSVVRFDDAAVLSAEGDDRLTLITCWPFRGWLHSPWRYVVRADRQATQSMTVPTSSF